MCPRSGPTLAQPHIAQPSGRGLASGAVTTPRGASAPPRVRDRLRAAADGPLAVVHAGRHAVYVNVDGWCVGVVGPGASRLPCALRVTDIREILGDSTRVRLTAYLGGGKLHIGGIPLPIHRLVGAYVPPLGVGATRQTGPVTVQATPPATVARFVDSQLPSGHIDAEAATRLFGRGEGLTPLGDDVLAGWHAMHRAAGVPTPEVDAAVGTAPDRTTLLSATLLDCARHGEVLPEYAAWVRAVGTDTEPAAVRALQGVGATSGAGLHAGGRLALGQLRAAA